MVSSASLGPGQESSGPGLTSGTVSVSGSGGEASLADGVSAGGFALGDPGMLSKRSSSASMASSLKDQAAGSQGGAIEKGNAGATRRSDASLAKIRAQVVDEVVALGSDPLVLENALRDTVEEEARLKALVKGVMESSASLVSATSEPGTGDLRRAQLSKALHALKTSLPSLQVVFRGASELDERITETREMADVVSRRVREIDLTRSRAILALGKVSRVIDLHACLKGVNESMKTGKLEVAADFVYKYRASATGEDTALSAEAEVDAADADAQAREELLRCEAALGKAALEKLNSAIKTGNDESVLASCRIFAKLGQAKESVSRLVSFKCEQLRKDVGKQVEWTVAQYEKASSTLSSSEDDPGPYTFVNLLVFLVNQGAATVQRTVSVVKKSISDEIALQVLAIEAIHGECGKLISEILRLFTTKTRIEERVKLILSSNAPDQLAKAVALGAASWDGAAGDVSRVLVGLETLLYDVVLMIQHTETYSSFIKGIQQRVEANDAVTSPASPSARSDSTFVGDVQELVGYYGILEEAYMVAAVGLAVDQELSLDHVSTSESNEALPDHLAVTKQVVVSSIAEDSFYVIDKCIDRAKATANIDSACAVVNHVVRILEEKIASIFEKRVAASKDALSSLSAQGQEQFDRLRQAALSQANALRTSAAKAAKGTVAGAVVPGPADATESTTILNTLESAETTLNSLQLCILNTNKLRSVLEHFAENLSDAPQASKLKECIDDLLEASEVFRRSLDTGLDHLAGAHNTSLRAKVESTFGAATCSFEVSEAAFQSLDAADDPNVMQVLQFCKTSIQHSCTGLGVDNTEAVGVRIAALLAKTLEHTVVRKKFTPFGALLFDRQLRVIMGSFEVLAGLTARDKFRRLRQIADLLNLDRVEDIHDVYMDGPSSLAGKEVKRVLALRSDFSTDDIKRLKL